MTEGERLAAKGQGILDMIESIRGKRAEQERLLAVLSMQAQVMLQGIDPEQVKSYGYDPTKDHRRKEPFWRRNGKVYNFVTLNDGTRIDLTEPIEQPG